IAGPMVTITTMTVEVVGAAAPVEIAPSAVIPAVAAPVAVRDPQPRIGLDRLGADHRIGVHLHADDAICTLRVADRGRRCRKWSGRGKGDAGRKGDGTKSRQVSLHRRYPLSVNVPRR